MSFLKFLAKKAAEAMPTGAAMQTGRAGKPAVPPPPAAAPKAPASQKPVGTNAIQQSFHQQMPQRAQQFSDLTGNNLFGASKPSAGLQQAAKATSPPAAGGQSWLSGVGQTAASMLTPYGLTQGWDSLANPLGTAAALGGSGIPGGWMMRGAVNKLAPGLANSAMGQATGKFLSGPGAFGNAWNLARSVSPWAAGGTAPANAFASLAGSTGAAGAAGTLGTAGLSMYGAYGLADLGRSLYESATGQHNMDNHASDQLEHRNQNGIAGYGGNVLTNLARPGRAALDMGQGIGEAPVRGTMALANRLSNSWGNNQAKDLREKQWKREEQTANQTLGSSTDPAQQANAQAVLDSIRQGRQRAGSWSNIQHGY